MSSTLDYLLDFVLMNISYDDDVDVLSNRTRQYLENLKRERELIFGNKDNYTSSLNVDPLKQFGDK